MIKINRKKFHLVTACVCVVLAVTSLILTAVSSASASSQVSQKAADVWSGDSGRDYSQISIFFTADAGFTPYSVRDFRTGMQTSFSKIPPDYFGEGVKVDKEDMWIDAYSMEASIRVEGSKATVTTNAVIAGGDFFFFRQFKFLSGNGFSDDTDGGYDLIVLDKDAAWQLFGSINVTGMTVDISGHPFVVCGVIEKEKTESKTEIYGKSPRVYISYDAYERFLNKSDADIYVTCYEAVVPNPIKDFAYEAVEANLSSVNEDSRKIVVNSERYDIQPLWKTFKSLAMRSVRTKDIIYPFWENAASVKADRLAVIMVIRLAFAIIVAVTGIVYILYGLVKFAGKFKRKKYKYL